jgi:phosphoribosylformylglycinamidine cyclo-ligase
VDEVNYNVLDEAKLSFIKASKATLDFASEYGRVTNPELGASANSFALDLTKALKAGGTSLYTTLVPEGLGTADDARPADLNTEELITFWWNIGRKVIACLTNDVATGGFRPLLLGLYLPSSTPESVFTDEFLSGFLGGVVDGCRSVGAVYLSGETPQLKSKYQPGRLDCAGSIFGVVPFGHEPITGEELRAGDLIVMVESSGPHENGFTTLRALAEDLSDGYRTRLPSGEEFWRAINRGSNLYSPLIERLLHLGVRPTAVENITGHGWQKLMRSRKPLRFLIDAPPHLPELFAFLKEALNLPYHELYKIFNCGAGYAIFVRDKDTAFQVIKEASNLNLKAAITGYVEDATDREVIVPSLGIHLRGEEFLLKK